MSRVASPSPVRADLRLAPCAVVAVLGTLAALVTGAAEYLALAAPALALLAHAARQVPAVGVVVDPLPDRVLEGDEVTVGVHLDWSGVLDLEAVVVAGDGMEVVPGTSDRWVHCGGPLEFEVALRATTWGRRRPGRLTLRVRHPGAMLHRDVVVDLPGEVRVLPRASRLDALVHPARPHASAGAHLAPVRGAGTDFADVRPYVPGDRLRDISWSASARSEHPWVVVHHPERAGTVVLLVDGFAEAGVPQPALDRAARIVWSLARHHLVNGDRVGLLAIGPTVTWLGPVAGRRSRWQVLDALLETRTPTAGAPGRAAARARPTLPPDAFVVGVSALQSDAFVADVVHHRRAGRPVVVVGVETADLLPAPTDERERAARRLWRLEGEVRRSQLSAAGVRTLLVADDATPAVRALGRARNRPATPSRRSVVAS